MGVEGRSYAQNLDALWLGQQICYSCPVQGPCLSTATEDDLAMTMRAGNYPTQDIGRPSGRPVQAAVSMGEGLCRNGHDRAAEGILGDGECYVCVRKQRERDNARRKELRDGLRKAAAAVLPRYQPEDAQCIQGHHLNRSNGRTAQGICTVCQTARIKEQSAARQQRRAERNRAKMEHDTRPSELFKSDCMAAVPEAVPA